MTIYMIGCLVAFVIGCCEAIKDHRAGISLEQFPSMICAITLLSWVFVVIYCYNKTKKIE